MIAAIGEAQPAIPQTVFIDNTKLPKMKEGEEVEPFLEMFELAMEDNNIPQAKWKGKIHAALTTETKLRVRDIFRDPGSTYENLKDALIGCGALTFSHASENLMTAEKGKTLTLPLRQAIHKWKRLLGRISNGIDDKDKTLTAIAVSIARYNTTHDLKTYLDTKGNFEKDAFCRNADEWLATQTTGTKWSRKSVNTTSPYDRPASNNKPYRPSNACFHCGKPGHYSRDCRTRLVEGRSPQLQQTVVKSEQTTPTTQTRGTDRPVNVTPRDTTCFYCQKKGHKSYQCPLRQVKCVQVAPP